MKLMKFHIVKMTDGRSLSTRKFTRTLLHQLIRIDLLRHGKLFYKTIYESPGNILDQQVNLLLREIGDVLFTLLLTAVSLKISELVKCNIK